MIKTSWERLWLYFLFHWDYFKKYVCTFYWVKCTVDIKCLKSYWDTILRGSKSISIIFSHSCDTNYIISFERCRYWDIYKIKVLSVKHDCSMLLILGFGTE